ncbi:MAG: hypothetical protein A4S17_01335 [Proteobacteria bacterium HN_bin10]|nr:MAG: hypothetical protein A4S17_01335 [Proteobacteria bacterium HN_bin10]
MGKRRRPGLSRLSWAVVIGSTLLLSGFPVPVPFWMAVFDAIPSAAAADQSTALSTKAGAGQPIQITAERLTQLAEAEIFEADGSVVITQGPLKLTADHVTVYRLTGRVVAKGHARLVDPTSTLDADTLELNINTQAGVVTDGRIYMQDTNTLVSGRLIQRFSEDHYRMKEGSFTNCDAKDGQVPAWRFTFKDLDLNVGESIWGKDVWLQVNDIPVVPLPAIGYPIDSMRKSGALVPTVGYDNRFGTHYRQGFFWAINPSQDLLVTPDILTNRGSGGDVEYRYILDKHSKGQWFVSFIEDNVVGHGRGQAIGTHSQKFNDDLSLHVRANLLSDRTILNNLSNSGTLRALPSQESDFTLNQRLGQGNLYLLGQYLQPVGAGSGQTFQRLPELGYALADFAPFSGGPMLVGADGTFVNFYRDQGFQLNRVDLMPTIKTDVVDLGHVVGVTPQLKMREVYYTRGVTTDQSVHRETFWASLDASSRLSRKFARAEGGGLLHTIEPSIIYEYVPPTNQSQIVQVDAVDDLPKKNLLTYAFRSKLQSIGADGSTFNWLDLTLAQSYHVGAAQTQARQFPFPTDPTYLSTSQPLQAPTVAVQGKKFSDLWVRGVVGNPVGTSALHNPMSLAVDAFFNPYQGNLTQWNTDLRYQQSDRWYVELGQRYTSDGNRVRRGDIWNPISFNEVFAPTPAVHYATGTIAARLPMGWTVGAKTYYDMKTGTRPETDVVGVYQNPCQCWSLALYYIQFPDRVQYNFLISLTGVGATEGYGTQLVKSILQPLMKDDKGVPWPTSGRRSGSTSPTQSQSGMGR